MTNHPLQPRPGDEPPTMPGDRIEAGNAAALPTPETISVVTVIWNDRQGLDRTMDSVRSQTYPRLEFIVIDGGSSDGTLQLIRDRQAEIDFWVSEPDRGIYDAMNKGLRRAGGHWILFLNAGDTFASPESLQLAFQWTGAFPSTDAFFFDSVRHDGGRAVGCRQPGALRMDSVGNHQSFLARTAMHERYPFDLKYRIKADRDVQLRMYLDGVSMKYVDQVISCFEAGGVSTTAIPRKEWENVRICWDRRVGWRWTAAACARASARLLLYAFSRATRIPWDRLKAGLPHGHPAPTRRSETAAVRAHPTPEISEEGPR